MFIYPKIILLTGILFLLTACGETPEVKNNRYTLEECKKEILASKDYKKEERIDLIIIEKKERKMYLYKEHEIQNIIPISLGKDPIGTKVKQGDNRTPEGQFWISKKICSPKYYRSLCISYPRPEDSEKAEEKGLNPGGDITIHAQPTWNADGEGDDHTLSKDWTQGCVAVTNSVMKQLWYAVHEGMPIIIR